MTWVEVADDAEVAPGGRVAVHAGGQRLALWRTSSGRLVACDARCPHQWSDLVEEGAVDGDELVCRSHGWRFAADGTGTKVNVHGRRDAKADVAVHEIRVVDGRISVLAPT